MNFCQIYLQNGIKETLQHKMILEYTKMATNKKKEMVQNSLGIDTLRKLLKTIPWKEKLNCFERSFNRVNPSTFTIISLLFLLVKSIYNK